MAIVIMAAFLVLISPTDTLYSKAPTIGNSAVVRTVPKVVDSVDTKVVLKIVPKVDTKIVDNTHTKIVPRVEHSTKTSVQNSVLPSVVYSVVPRPVVKPTPKPVPTYYRKSSEGLEMSKYEYELLVKIAHSEAGGDGMASQIGVVNVVLNRVASDGFPNTIPTVVYQDQQFSVVEDGRINEPVEAMNYEAVDRVLAGENNVGEALFFWANYVRADHYLWSKPVLYRYGITVFSN